ncbi:MAG: Gfo/Idh/MocA family oxidoreductase [Gemmataceae bacterium]|nr:Gfo/Idh/MocA family oxidoreductase [Gemmataceae bacterium]MCI0743730.1 Gfo/Idh/MocA family oxidoreductase [Gemmataceae bacterium]
MVALGMVGAGRWGGNWLKTLAGLADVELRWCCDVSPASLDKVRRQFPHVRVTTRLEDLLEDDALAGVVVASVAPTHYDVGRRVLQAGKHVLIEKPMTLRTADAIELTELAQRQNRVLMVGHLLEYHPIVRRIGEMIDQGELGDVFFLYSQRLNLGTIRSDENAWWSLAPHDVSVACRLMGGAPISVQCRGQSIIDPRIADVVFATLEFPGGRLAQFHVSWIDPHKSRKLTVVGSKKSAIFDDTGDRKFVLCDKGFERTAGPGVVTLRQGEEITLPWSGLEPLALEAQHFVECIRYGRRPVSDGLAGAMVVSVLEYGQRSLDRGGEVIAIPPTRWPLRKSA